MNINPDFNIEVATVCGDEVRVFSSYDGLPRRKLVRVLQFKTKGAAQLYAMEHDEAQRKSRETRQR